MKAENLAKMKKLQREARQRILERSKVEFRVDPELMSALLDVAKKSKMSLGPMIRDWVKARLAQEMKKPLASQNKLDIIERKIDKLLSSHNKASA
jgi:predicted HicB family RNase H-like nuclease